MGGIASTRTEPRKTLLGTTSTTRRSLRFRSRLLLLLFAVGVAAVATMFGGILSGSRSSATTPAPAAAAPFGAQLPSLPAARDTAGEIVKLQSRLRAEPDDAASLTLLGLEYEQRARETGDPTYYSKAEGVLRDAHGLAPSSPLTVGGLASLALSRHRFAEALALGRRALALGSSAGVPNAIQSRGWGIAGDALVELGRYGEAFDAFDRMMKLEPGLGAYTRASYARELLGRPRAALAPMRAAVNSSNGEPEPLAWTRVQLGKLYWSTGRLEPARRAYRRALAAFPGYVFALDALAQVEAARGRYDRAIALERRAVAKIPLPQFAAALGDLLRLTGREAAAKRQYALVDAIRRLLNANGVRTDLEIALFQADHSIRLPQALELARAAQRDRPSVDGDDVLAWALERNGRCREALGYSTRALRLGTLDALKFFHRGMIERCLGRKSEARRWFRRSLGLNAHFSLLWAPVAERLAR
jgi:tetratricopeptide (TPR) repeat protein